MQLENKIFGKMRLVAPDNPANTTVRKTEFVARSVDGHDTGKLEVP
jgi:hypothetical protein